MRLTANQQNTLDQILLRIMGNTLKALENIFSLGISSSDSSIEIITALDNENLKYLGSGTLYSVSSRLEGDIEGQMLVLMRSTDFEFLGRLMKPVLGTYSESDIEPGAEETKGDVDAPVQTGGMDAAMLETRMLEMLTEMGNILCGVYSRAIFNVCSLNTHHCLPVVTMDNQQLAIQQILSHSATEDPSLLVIASEFFVMDNPIRFWCLISPTAASFRKILLRLEAGGDAGPKGFSFAQYSHPTHKD